jgi:hypothetical protein
MSGISEHSRTSNEPVESTQTRPAGSNGSDLSELVERLALIQGHVSEFPVSGARVFNGFLLVALRIPNHVIEVYEGEWLVDGLEVSKWDGD